MLSMADAQLKKAAALLGLDAGMEQWLRVPERKLQVAVPVKMDDGTLHVFDGYRIQHSTARGPAKGGIRYHPGVTADEVQALATLKTPDGIIRIPGFYDAVLPPSESRPRWSGRAASRSPAVSAC